MQSGPSSVEHPVVVDESGKMEEDGDEPGKVEASADSGDADDSQLISLRDPTTRPVFKLSVRLLDTYKYINKVH